LSKLYFKLISLDKWIIDKSLFSKFFHGNLVYD
jgi:hypothetical protein